MHVKNNNNNVVLCDATAFKNQKWKIVEITVCWKFQSKGA